MRIALYVNVGLKGLLVSVGKRLMEEGHEVWILAQNKYVVRHAKALCPNIGERLVCLDDWPREAASVPPLVDARTYENRYGMTFSMLLSFDRGLGQGYLVNADRHPFIIRSLWTHEQKILSLLRTFRLYESVCENIKPDLIFCFDRIVPLSLIAKHSGIPMYHITTARIGDRFMLSDGDYFENQELFCKVKEYAGQGEKTIAESDVNYEAYTVYKEGLQEIKYTYGKALKKALYIFAHEVYKRIRGLHDPAGYAFCGWIPPAFRKIQAHNYFSKYGKNIEDLKGYSTVYFPLQMEPESTLMQFCPEFNSSIELIYWVSKSLPADHLLVVKENPWSFGIRSQGYYRRLRKIPNVVLAHPTVSSWDWIKHSVVTTTFSGTAGFEAVYFGKPVLNFGLHMALRDLPTVRTVESYRQTKAALDELLAMDPGERDFLISRHALHRAIMETSFDLHRVGTMMRGLAEEPEEATTVVRALKQREPELFAS